MHIHLDLVGGISGDMFVAALLDTFPDLQKELLVNLKNPDSLRQIKTEVIRYNDGVLTGMRFIVKNRDKDPHHRSFQSIKNDLGSSDLDDKVAQRAISIFWELAKAEGKVHGKNPEEVQFHEVGAWDSIADIVSAAFLIEKLNVSSWSVSPIPLGSGRVQTAHGSLPIPAPATAILLENFPVFDDGVEGERVTPTGAAILKHLNPAAKKPAIPMRLVKSGYGFGTGKFLNISNVLRVMVLDDVPADEEAPNEMTADINFEIDDQTAEDLAVGIDHIRNFDGVLDIIQAPVFGKKGRLATHIQVLASLDKVEQVINECFNETTTIGVRWHKVYRKVLPRQMQSVRIEDQDIFIKSVNRPGDVVTAKADIKGVSKVKTWYARDKKRTDAENCVKDKNRKK